MPRCTPHPATLLPDCILSKCAAEYGDSDYSCDRQSQFVGLIRCVASNPWPFPLGDAEQGWRQVMEHRALQTPVGVPRAPSQPHPYRPPLHRSSVASIVDARGAGSQGPIVPSNPRPPPTAV